MSPQAVTGIVHLPTAPAPAKPGADSKKIADAASQFEALLLTELLKSVREGSADWMGDSDDQSGSSLNELAQEQFAMALAASGGLGFAKMITAQLDPSSGGPSKIR